MGSGILAGVSLSDDHGTSIQNTNRSGIRPMRPIVPVSVRVSAAVSTSRPVSHFFGWVIGLSCGLIEQFPADQHAANLRGAGTDFIELGVSEQATGRILIDIAIGTE